MSIERVRLARPFSGFARTIFSQRPQKAFNLMFIILRPLPGLLGPGNGHDVQGVRKYFPPARQSGSGNFPFIDFVRAGGRLVLRKKAAGEEMDLIASA
jgi:hypothetical protein